MKLELADVIDLDSLQEIQDCFAKATGLAAITVDYQGRPLLRYSSFTRFCSKLREHPRYYEKCLQSDAHSSLEAARVGRICIHRCHAGLVDFAVPIIVDGEYVASMLCGQAKMDAFDEKEVNTDLIKLSDDIFTEIPELRQLYDEIPTLPFNRIREAAHLFYLMINYTIEQYLLNQKNIKLLEAQKEKITLEKQYNDLEMLLHHSQVTPHFLFNALNTAGRQAMMEGAKKTQDTIYALADMYRYSMTYSGHMIPVANELQNLRNYLFIQEISFGEQLHVSIDIKEDIQDYLVPAMSLQIFVENSIRHGLEKKEDLGYVEILGSKKEDRLHFEITDNGIGMSFDQMKSLNDDDYARKAPPRFEGVGIYNVCKRLRYFFSDDFSVVFSNGPDRGIKVTLSLPAVLSPKTE